ncbi:MAG TPA: MerR family transcriptional regulator [Anaerolineales bacterium]
MSYTVKQISDLAGVSARTLHYYDEIGLLKPASYGENGYRYYGEAAVLRLQQILFFKELDFNLEEIKTIVDSPEFDVLYALQAHKVALQRRVKRINQLIATVDQTILHLKGKSDMSKKQLFEGFSEEKQKQYEQEIRQRYGERAFEGTKDWNSYSTVQKEKIKAEGEAVYRDLVEKMDKGPASPEVQRIIARWHRHLRYFYEPSVERLLGLADLYNDHPDFVATFQKSHPDLPEFLRQAIQVYSKTLK